MIVAARDVSPGDVLFVGAYEGAVRVEAAIGQTTALP